MAEKKLVHVLDDDPTVLTSLGRLLRSAGCAVQLHADYSSLLSSSLMTPGDCLILDYTLADDTGLEVMGRLQRKGINLPIIFITASTSETVRGLALAAGARNFFHKPVDGTELLAAIAAITN